MHQQKPVIPEDMRQRWQRILKTAVAIFRVPAGLIIRVEDPGTEVFAAHVTGKLSLNQGMHLPQDSGLYCEQVIRKRSSLLVPDALKDSLWAQSSGAAAGMTYYLGYPIAWPDQEIFGTICILDSKENTKATQFRELLSEFRTLLEKDLRILVETETRESLLKELQDHRSRLEQMISERTAELERSKEMLEERVRFEQLFSSLSASLVSVPSEHLDSVIEPALEDICRLFAADHCALLELPANGGPARFLNMTDREERRQKGISLDLVDDHPWAYRQLVERGDTVVFSSPDDLPAEAATDRAAWTREGTEAGLIVPLWMGGRATHLIALRRRTRRAEWPTILAERLRVFGEIIIHVLSNKRSHDSLGRSESQLAQAQHIARLGSWEWDLRLRTHRWSDEFYRIFGLVPQECSGSYDMFLELVHPDDRAAVDLSNQEALADPQKKYSVEYRIVPPGGEVRVVHALGEVIFDSNGKPVRMIGTLHDITERKRAEQDLQSAFEEIRRLKEQIESENIYLKEENKLRAEFAGIVGISNPLKYVEYRIQQVARTRTTVLLTGETGTGKGLFARALHEASDRKDKLFVNVNCAGLPPNLIESELFGREKGAFTGSTARQIGRFELADGGTLFLDEVGELPLELQAKLLKAIEEGEFERLGSPHPVKVDVRIIASTNRSLQEEIEKGEFRKDLFYRLSVFPITIPPLRQRREDIPLLAAFYTKRFAESHAKPIKSISKKTMRALENYDWPGNVRELMNVIERAVILSEGPELQLREALDSKPSNEAPGDKDSASTNVKELVQVEREHILHILLQTGWRIEGEEGAAKVLGIHPSTMRARMKKLGIHRPGFSQSSSHSDH